MNTAGTTAYYFFDGDAGTAHPIDTNGSTHTEAVDDLIDFWNSTVDDKVVEPFEVYSEEDNDDETITIIKGELAARDEDGEYTDDTNEITIIVETDKD